MKLLPCLLWVIIVLPASSQETLQTLDTRATLPRVEIRFNLYRDYLIVVQGSLGPLERLNFLIDTGANPTAIDRKIAKKLALKGEAAKLALFNRDASVEQVLLPRLQPGPIQAKSLPAFVQDLSPVEQALGIRIDAIIGFGVLSLSSFTIDYRSRKIVFGPVETSLLAIPFETGFPTFTVRLQTQEQSVRLLVDTGAAELLLFDCQLHGHLRGLPTSGVTRSTNAANAQFEMKQVWLPAVHLGGADFGLQKAFLVHDGRNCGRTFDGIMGVSSLGLERIGFDFENRTFNWKK